MKSCRILRCKNPSSKSLDRDRRLRTRGWVRVAQVAALGRAADDAVVGHQEVNVLHADGVVAVGPLVRVGDVGSGAVGVAGASQVAVDLDVALGNPNRVALLIVPCAGSRVARGGADLLGLGAAEVVVVRQGRGDGSVFLPDGELRLDLGGELVVPRRSVGGARLVEVHNRLVAGACSGAVNDLAGVLPVGIRGLVGDDEEVGPAVEAVDGRGGQPVVAGGGDVFAVAVFVLGGAGGVARVDAAVGEVFGILADVACLAFDHVNDFGVDGGGDGGCRNQRRGESCEPDDV